MKKVVLAAIFLSLISFSACKAEKEGSLEKAGKKMDEGIHKAGDKIDEGLDKAGDKIKEKTDKE